MKRWRKLHTHRSPRFEALPVGTRGLLAELVAVVEDDGWLRLGTSDRGTLWRYIAAHPNERRYLAAHLDALIRNGSVEESEEGWFLPSFVTLQEDAEGSPTGRRRAAGVLPTSRRHAADVLPEGSRRAADASTIEAKSAESGPGKSQSRREEKRADQKRPPTEVRGGEPLALVSPVGTLPRKRSKKPPEVGPSAATWAAYAEAHEARYGVPPVRNARVNAQVAQVVSRLGAEEAPEVARFFVEHNAGWYVTKGHPIGALLADAEKLRTEWATGRRITRGDARNAEVVDEMRAQSDRIEAALQRRKEGIGQ